GGRSAKKGACLGRAGNDANCSVVSGPGPSITQGCGLTYFLVQITGRWCGTSREKQYLRYKAERRKERREARQHFSVVTTANRDSGRNLHFLRARAGSGAIGPEGGHSFYPIFIIVCALAALYVRFSGLSILTAAFTG